MNSPEENVKLIIDESERLYHFLKYLPAEDWNTPSACGQWEVADVVAHLTIQAKFYTDAVTRSLQGENSTPKGLSDTGSFNTDFFAKINAERSIDSRKKMGDQLLNEFVKSSEQLNRTMTGINKDDWDKPHFFHSLGTAPLKYRPAMRLCELILHGWDIRSKFESDIHFPKEALPVLLWLFSEPLMRWLFHPGPKLDNPGLFRFLLTDIESFDKDILVNGDSATISAAGSENASLTCKCAAEIFILVMSGRFLLSDALTQNRLLVEGDIELVDKFAQWFQSV